MSLYYNFSQLKKIASYCMFYQNNTTEDIKLFNSSADLEGDMRVLELLNRFRGESLEI